MTKPGSGSFLPLMDEMMEVMDQQGRRFKMPRQEYANQLLQAARQNWNTIEVLRQIAPQLLNDGFPKEALEVAERAYNLSNGHVPDTYWRAAALAENGRLDEAAAAFEELQEDAAYPADQARATMGLARVRAKQGLHEQTEELLHSAVEMDPDSPQLLLALYGFYNERGEAKTGMEKMLDAADKNPHSPVPYRALAQIALSAGDKEELKRCVVEALQRAKTGEEQQDLLAEVTFWLGQAGMSQEIINLVEPHVQNVHQPFALLNLAQALHDVGRSEHAKNLLDAIRKAAPPEMAPIIDQRMAQITGSGAEENKPTA